MNRWTLSKRGEVSGCPRYICSEPPKVAMAAKRNRQTWTIIWLIVSGASDMLRLLWRGGPHPLDHFGLAKLSPRWGPPRPASDRTWRYLARNSKGWPCSSRSDRAIATADSSFRSTGAAKQSTERLTPTGCRGRLDRVQHAVARDRVIECGAEMGSVAIVAGETRIRLGDVGGRARALRRRAPILVWHGEELERGLRTLAAAYGHFEDLCLAAGGRKLQIALGAVDLPHQIRAARTAAAVVDRECGPALEQSGDAHLVIRSHGLAFARLRDREGLSAHSHGGRELSHLAEAVTQRVRRVADRDREHRRAVFLVVEVGVVRLHRRSPAHSRTDQRGGEHLTDVALVDKFTHVRHRWRRTGLQSCHGEDTLLLRQCRQGLRLIQAVAKRPFAVHGLARVERCSRQFEVIGHFHGDGDDIHGTAVYEVVVIVERERHTKALAGGGGRFASAGGQCRDLEVIRE